MQKLTFDACVSAGNHLRTNPHAYLMERGVSGDSLEQLDGGHEVDHGLADTGPDQVGHYARNPHQAHHETPVLIHVILPGGFP